jgi:hypothetical protein
VDTWASRSIIHEKIDIKYYGRYRDDLLIIWDAARGDRLIKIFVHQLQVYAKYFRLKIEETNCTSLKFLQVTLNLDVERGMITSRYTHKSPKGPPLTGTSAHHPSQLVSWPGAMKTAIMKLSSFRRWGDDAGRELEENLFHYSLPILPVPVPSCTGQREITKWLPMPYHPVVSRFMNKALRDFMADFGDSTRRIFGSSPGYGTILEKISPAWRKGGPQLLEVLRKLGRR